MGSIKNISITRGSVGKDTVTFTVNCNCESLEEIKSITCSSDYTLDVNSIDIWSSGTTATATVKDLLAGTSNFPSITVSFKTWAETVTVEGYKFKKNGVWLGTYGNINNAAKAYIDAVKDEATVEPTSGGTGIKTYTYEGQTCYFYEVTSSSWGYQDSGSSTKTFTCYTHPENFYFSKNNYSDPENISGWNTKAGLQTLLENIYNFNTVAYQWKKWYNWNIPTDEDLPVISACSGFTKGQLTAQMLNDAYGYLGITTNYKKGDKVAASMFRGLEAKINSSKDS